MKRPPSKSFLWAIICLGISTLAIASAQWRAPEPVRFVCYLGIAVAASTLKVRLPGVSGTMSVNFVFVLIGVAELNLSENILIVSTAVAMQCFYHAEKWPRPIQVAFNLASTSVAVVICYAVYHSSYLHGQGVGTPLRLAFSSITYFLANTFPVASIIALTENKRLRQVWRECYLWTFPFYLAGAAVAGLFHFLSSTWGWQIAILTLPAVVIIYCAYRLYLGRLEDEKSHAQHMAALHLRTIEALALAIDAKDHATHDHLRRVQLYAVEIGREMGLPEAELEALRAAALLHDIGKLAVPEHIISKPGKLTAEEFEKMKIHPIVGAEILERVQFPYPVVPIVRSHHEKWNGMGYPDGLKEDQIPIAARILSAVDCLDAIASERQYRRALPLDEAIKIVESEAGKSYDPAVVEILRRRYKELEAKAQKQPKNQVGLSTAVRSDGGHRPAVGFEQVNGLVSEDRSGFLTAIASARQEVQALFELSNDLGNSLSLTETLSMVALRLKTLVPYDSIAVYRVRDNVLVPEYVAGSEFGLFSSLAIPWGQGLSGWVAENRKPIINGNPSVEPGYLNEPTKFSILRSALAVPLEAADEVIGVLTLYHPGRDAFSKDHLRVLLALSSRLAMFMENANRFQQAQASATTDYLSGLPNARSLFLHLDAELSRSRRCKGRLTVLVCDLDGFKDVNDRLGHLAGNHLLKLVADGLRASCRECDYVARMGGDEFVITMPDIAESHLASKVSQFRSVVEKAGRQILDANTLSVSVGTACYPADGTDVEALLSKADQRMYIEKQHQKLMCSTQNAFEPVAGPVQ